MKETLEFIAKNLVSNPDGVSVEESEIDGQILLKLRVDPTDMGKVIGRGGRMARDIRMLMRSAAAQQNKRVTVDIVD